MAPDKAFQGAAGCRREVNKFDSQLIDEIHCCMVNIVPADLSTDLQGRFSWCQDEFKRKRVDALSGRARQEFDSAALKVCGLKAETIQRKVAACGQHSFGQTGFPVIRLNRHADIQSDVKTPELALRKPGWISHKVSRLLWRRISAVRELLLLCVGTPAYARLRGTRAAVRY